MHRVVSEELSGRYGVDYRVVVCDEPAKLASVVRELLAAGTLVALVIGGVGETDPDGIEVLARVRGIDRTVPRVAAVRWGGVGCRTADLRGHHDGQDRPLGDAPGTEP